MNLSDIVYVGTGGSVVAYRKSDGHQLWQQSFPGGPLAVAAGFVTLLVDGPLLFAHAMGEVYCLDALTGEILWRDGLKGLGYQVASIAIAGKSALGAEAAAVVEAQRNHQHTVQQQG